jgi:hypothetical protein
MTRNLNVLFLLLLFSCSPQPDTAEQVLEKYLTSSAAGDCETALELAVEEAKEVVERAIEEGCKGNSDEILSINCEENNDIATCYVSLTREAEPFGLPQGRYTYNYTYSMKKENEIWKVWSTWKSMNFPEELILNMDSISNERTGIDTTSLEKSINEKYQALFNTELVGLSKDENNAERFYGDFSSACMCDVASILLTDTIAYLYNYCQDTIPPLSQEPFYTYDIIEKKELPNGLLIHLVNKDNEKLSLQFNESDQAFIYTLKIVGEFPSDYIGNTVSEFFTYKLENFEIENCGEFDG